MPGFFLFAMVVVFVSIFLFAWYNAPERVARRALAKLPVLPIANIPEGALARVTGRVRIFGQPRVAPLSGRPCAFYRVRVLEKRTSEKGTHWRTIVDETAGSDFLVVDDSGKALIRYERSARFVVVKDVNLRSGTFHDPTPTMNRFLEQRGHSGKGWILNKEIRYHEGVLEPGETVTIAGRATWEPDPEPEPGADSGYRTAPQRLVVKADQEFGMIVTDNPSLIHVGPKAAPAGESPEQRLFIR